MDIYKKCDCNECFDCFFFEYLTEGFEGDYSFNSKAEEVALTVEPVEVVEYVDNFEDAWGYYPERDYRQDELEEA